MPQTALANEETAKEADAPLSCIYTLPEEDAGGEGYLCDGRTATHVSLRKGGVISVSLPEEAAYLYLVWYSRPDAPALCFFDAAGEALAQIEPDSGLLYQTIEIPDGSESATLGAAAGLAVSELRAYMMLPEGLLTPEPALQKTDVLLVAAHTGDESYYFGGLIPILAAEKGYTVTVLFLSSESREAEEQAMLSLAACGVTEQPMFAELSYRLRPYGTNCAQVLWGKTAAADVIAQAIRACRPEIVITHDPEGEDGDAMHAYAALMTRQGIERAANDQTLPVADGAPAAWQAARLYEHSAEGGSAVLPVDEPLLSLDGLTAREMARLCYERYGFLRLYHKTALAADTPYYQLAEEYRAPAADPLLNLNIDPMPAPSPAPTPEPSPASTPETMETPETAESGYSRFCAFLRRHCAAILSISALATAGLGLYTALRRADRLPLRMALCMIPLAAGLILALALPAIDAAETAAREAAITPTPTPTSTPSPTPSPTPTPTPDPQDAYFRQENEPEETVVFDNDSGRYAYRSDTLSVEIQRYDIRNVNDEPVRYFVAHVRMRSEDAFRPGFGNYRENGDDPTDPFVMARRYQAVLAISGDNMINFDVKNKGVIIRNGTVYLDSRNGSTMVLTPDGMRMYSLPSRSTDAEALVNAGIRHSFSFGPVLISGGVINEEAIKHYLAGYNPRVGVGLAEEGHFVVIVVEGRVGKYSRGVRMEEFAQLFSEQGCTEAYNLDGGASSSMLFMGEYINRRMPDQYRNVPDLLMWGYSELVPGVDETPVNDLFYRS